MTDEELNLLAEKHCTNFVPPDVNRWAFSLPDLRDLITAACPAKDISDSAGLPMSEVTYGAVHKVYLRVGMLVMRELINRELLGDMKYTTWPTALCPDPGPLRLLNWSEVVTGPEDGPYEIADMRPEVEALPIARQIVNDIWNTPAPDVPK